MEIRIKQMLMSPVELRSEIDSFLDQVKDESFLRAVHSMLGTYTREQTEPIIGYTVGTNEPILASEADEAFEAVVEDVKAGNFTEIDDLIEERSARW